MARGGHGDEFCCTLDQAENDRFQDVIHCGPLTCNRSAKTGTVLAPRKAWEGHKWRRRIARQSLWTDRTWPIRAKATKLCSEISARSATNSLKKATNRSFWSMPPSGIRSMTSLDSRP